MNLTSSRFCTCFFISAAFSGLVRRNLCATDLLPSSTESLWLEKFGPIPGMLAAVHANKSTFLLRKWVSCALISSKKCFATIVPARLLVRSVPCQVPLSAEAFPEFFFRVAQGLQDGP
ncbi:hypothetical protein PIB30_090482 [Stylosanthes scabra]|uniref:Secreted protein n=1 Tax=Stylosanthes scabra TaxID=79078 RepID=A0ABU6XWU8_9FABA|nr:hypothetical protein [Stylosanthes scabra]